MAASWERGLSPTRCKERNITTKMTTNKALGIDTHICLSKYIEILIASITEYMMKATKKRSIIIIDILKQKTIATNDKMMEALNMKFLDYMEKCEKNCPTEEVIFKQWAKETWGNICGQQKLVNSMIITTNQKQVCLLVCKIIINMGRVSEFLFNADHHLLKVERELNQRAKTKNENFIRL
jgi:hypothetical protein